MRTQIPFLAFALMCALLVTAGCQTGGANCCVNWDFYKECDLVEGRATRDCCGETVVTTCEPTPCGPGVVLVRTMAVPVESAPVGQPMGAPEVVVEEEIDIDASSSGE